MPLKTLKTLISDRNPLRLLWHHSKALVAAIRYGFPARKLIVTGITGTDGKTTTVAMLTHILHTKGIKTGAVTTTHFTIGHDTERNVTQKTSISAMQLQKLLRRMVRAGCTHAIIEISSHGLVQGRVNHLYPLVAAVTNLAPEHLDYHKTMEQYTKDKGLLFHMLRKSGTKIINQSDASYELYRTIPTGKTITYGASGTNLWATRVKATTYGVTAEIHRASAESISLTLPIAGVFNVENALCAMSCALALGIPLKESLAALTTFTGVPGRLEELKERNDFRVFLDFTVTVQSYEKVLKTLRAMAGDKRVLVLTGACGNRMREKRPEQGRVCSNLADMVVVTSDETYGEPYESIMNDLWSGIDQTQTEAHRIEDRKEAITFILKQAKPGDIVAICGMAGVTTMMTAKGQIPWDEDAIVRKALHAMLPVTL